MTAGELDITVDVLIVGGGPAGLTAAARLAPQVRGSVLVVEREQCAGGIPRHSEHPGYGIRDLKRFLSGPAYAGRLVHNAITAGAVIRTDAMVTNWCGPTAVEVTSPGGRYRVDARVVVLATGARERPRAARLIPGDRPAGVLTTGQLQNLVHLQKNREHQAGPGTAPGLLGTAAVVVGAQLVSWSAVLTLKEAGVRTVLMTSTYARPESYGVVNLAGRLMLRAPVRTRTAVTRIVGKGRVEAVEIRHLDSGRQERIACDTIVFTGDWIPDHELARSAGLVMDAGTRGPLVDSAQRTSTPGVFAVGNLTHPVDTADIAALDGAAVAGQVLDHLDGEAAASSSKPSVRLLVEPPLRWISPGLLRADDPAPPRGRYLLWTDELVRLPRVQVHQAGKLLSSSTVAWPASPGRVFRLPSGILRSVDPHGDDVRISLRPR